MSVAVGIIVGIVLVIYAIAYSFYGGRLLQKKVVKADPNRPTPAVSKYDGVDYVPANKYVLYGHHFASIAGAGPIVGPAIAMAYGWLLPLIWVLFGNVFIGAVHDYLALMASVRYGGVSIGTISENVMGRTAKYVFLAYLYAALILVLAAFLSINARIYAVVAPQAATKAMAYMPIAVFLGFLMYRLGLRVVYSTIVALVLIVLMLLYSYHYPLYIPGLAGLDPYHTWLLFLALYSFIASGLPVWYLLQPRDYLNAYLLWSFVGIAAASAVLVAWHGVTGPAYITFAPTLAGFAYQPTPFWPAIPLIIACGALSGFHSLVASGTSSKQLANELDALLVGYGGMLTEGAVSSLAVITPVALAWQAPDFPQLLEVAGKSDLIPVYMEKGILGIGGPLVVFSYSYGYMVGKAFSLGGFNAQLAHFFVIYANIALATFILTTLDTATRLARFTWQEMFTWLEPRSRTLYKILTNRWVASLLAVLIGLALAFPDVKMIVYKEGVPTTVTVPAFRIIWPAFAGTNQLLAALALLTSALWVYLVLRVRGAVNLLIQIPALFLWITVTAGLTWWLVIVAPALAAQAPVQGYGSGAIVALTLAIDIMLIALYVKALLRHRAQAQA